MNIYVRYLDDVDASESPASILLLSGGTYGDDRPFSLCSKIVPLVVEYKIKTESDRK